MKVKAKFVPEVAIEFKSTEDFENLLNTVAINVKEGTVVKGKVVGIGKEVVVIDVGLKNEGRIPVAEFRFGLPEVGDLVDVYVDKLESRNSGTVLSREKAIREESWAKLEVAYANNELVDGVIFGRVKGGFTVDISGVVAFLPGIQVDVRPIKDIEPLMNIVQPLQILKMDKKLGNVVVSRRAILEESRSEARDEMLASMKEGMILEGVVKNIVNYGAFVDLGMCDGLLHLIDISWNRINHPSEVLQVGQKIKVMVIKYNEEKKRISLGMKQLEDNPWNGYDKKYTMGTIVKGKVTDFADYGAFVQLDNEDIEGLVYYSEISWSKNNQNPKKLLTLGQEVTCKVLELDVEKHRISLSIKQCINNPWIEFYEKHPVGSIISGEVRNVADFGMFIAIGGDIDGMVRDTDIAQGISGAEALKLHKKGDIVTCKVLSIDVEKEKVSLGIRQAGDAGDPDASLGIYKKGQICTCTASSIEPEGVFVELEDGQKGFIKKAELSSEKSEQKVEKFNIGDRFDAYITSVSKQKNLVNLSIKVLEAEERDRAIKEYGSTDSGASLGDILGAALKKSN